MPEEFEYLWIWWRTEVFSGDELSYTALHAWAQVTRKELQGWEANVIMKLDRIFWQVKREQT